jgi:hypothetical protein
MLSQSLLTERQAEAIKRVPPISRPIIRKAWESKVRDSHAITAYCLMCEQGKAAAIRDCADDTCPLLHSRPFQNYKGK